MSARNYSTFCALWSGVFILALGQETPFVAVQVPADPGGGGAQILPNPPSAKADSDVPGELSDLQREPRPGLYNSAPWSMIIRVPGPVAAPMPTTVPPKGRFHERSIEPEILLIPRDEPRFH